MDNYSYSLNGNKPVTFQKILFELDRRSFKKHGLISLKQIHSIMGQCFHMNKDLQYEYIFEMKERGMIEFIPFWGIRILKNGQATSCEQEGAVC